MTELWKCGALDLADKIRHREVSSREVVEAHLARVAQVNPHLNAVVRLLTDEALVAADTADRATVAGAATGRFPWCADHCQGKHRRCRAPDDAGRAGVPDAVALIDTPTVARMRAAGAIPFARSNMPDFGLRVHTDSSLHGLTRNPWDQRYTVGGSSGGEGSALASGMSPLGLGNDIGGSLRNPAHCCGIASIKPTVGVVPMATVIPPEDMMIASQLMVVEGPMARHVADVRAALEVLSGPDIRDPRSLPVQLTDLQPGQKLRIAVMATPPGGTTNPGIADGVRRAAAALAAAGHQVVEATPPDYEEVVQLWAALLAGDIRVQRPLLDMAISEDARAVLDGLDAGVPPMGPTELLGLHARRFALMRSWSEFFAEHPVLLSPTWAHPPFEHGADISDSDLVLDTLRPVLPANFLALPAVIVPTGVDNGMPTSVQIIGDRFTDLRCLSVGAQVEAALGRITPIDPVL